MTDLTNHGALTELLQRHGFHFSKALGQNFLTAAWVPERIAEEACLTPETPVLEIGPGVGCLTRALAERAGRVLALELDRRLEGVLSETLGGQDNVRVVFTDAVKADLPALCREHLGPEPWTVCANLPYGVTTPLVTALLEAEGFARMTLMVQREVAERMCARPGGKDYGAFTLLAQWHAETELLFTVPPHCFTPQPKVTSAVVRLTRRAAPPAEVRSRELLFRVIRAAFAQRRKTLPNALAAALPELGREGAEACLTQLGLSPRIRGERLSILQFAELSNAIFCRMDK